MLRLIASLMSTLAFFAIAPLAAAATIVIDTVPVGNQGNAADPATGSLYGAVDYAYNMAKYDVTNAQYAAFLNAKDAIGTNVLGLYSGSMASDGINGGINFASGNSVGNKYIAKAGHESQPVNYVSWYDAIRFANWLNNGQGSANTETGAYTLGALGPGGVPLNGPNIGRNPGATVFLPSESEWYKSAYFNPATSTYFQYPTSSNSAPIATGPTGASNSANFNNAVGHLTPVGAYTSSASPYGTFDQGGNLWQWTEDPKSGFLSPGDFPGTFRTLRGGAHDTISNYLQSSSRIGNHETDEGFLVGFRIASVPEPGSLVLATLGILGSLAVGWRRKKR